jgi:membrane protein DedA with SNARE-associated domain
MPSYFLLYRALHAELSTPLGMSLAIILGTFILEDATMVAVGVMAADGLVPIPLGLASLASGIALGDFGLYGIGRLARAVPWLQRWVDSEKLRPLRSWLAERLYATVISTRFLPGMRLPTYLACGFFAVSFRRFAIPVVGATILWCALLFTCTYYFGVYTLSVLGFLRWPVALGAIVVLTLVGRAHWKQVTRGSGDHG